MSKRRRYVGGIGRRGFAAMLSVVLLVGLLVLAGACSAKGGYAALETNAGYGAGGGFSGAADSAAFSELSAKVAVPGEASQGQMAGEATRKLVKNASLRIRVSDPEALDGRIAEIMKTWGAYAAQAAIYENSRSYTIRTPAASFDSLLGEIGGLGKILYRSENTEDVTLRYYDLAGRLATKEELLKTYRAYLGRAQNIEEILSVESKIADLQNEIDWTGTQLRSLTNLVNYATIELELVGPVSTSPYAGPSVGERIAGLFRSFGDYASAVLVVLLGVLVYGIPSLIILALLLWLLFGKVGVLKKLWFLVMGKKHGNE